MAKKTVTFTLMALMCAALQAQIFESANPATVGCPDTFYTTLHGSNMQWIFPAPVILIDTFGPGGDSTSVAFIYPGTFEVYLQVDGALQDSVQMMVLAGSGNVNLIESADTICQGSTLYDTASPSSYLAYAFFIDDSLAQFGGKNNFAANKLLPGDSIWVMGYNGTCYTAASNRLHPVINPIPTAAVLTSSVESDTICGGDTVTFTATPGYQNYIFYNGGSIQKSSPSNTWTTSQLGQGNNVIVEVENNGCISPASNSISLTVKPTPSVIPSSPNPVCQGDSITVTTQYFNSPMPPDSFIFFLNSQQVQGSPSNIYSTNTLVNNDTLTVITKLDGCAGPVSFPIVFTIDTYPVVELLINPSYDSVCLGQPCVFTASPAYYSNYTFFINADAVQTDEGPQFSTDTLLSGDNVYVEAWNGACPSNSNIISVVTLPSAEARFTFIDSAGTIYFTDNSLFEDTNANRLWYFGDGDSSIQQNPVHVFSPGVYYVCLTVKNPGQQCEGQFCRGIAVGVNSINGPSVQNVAFTLYPNPCSQFLNLLFFKTEEGSITIADLLGRELAHFHINASQLQITTSNLSNGVYLLNFSSALGEINTKIVVNH